MFGNLAEMANMVKKAKEIKNNMKAMKEELSSLEVSGTSADGKIIAIASGDFIVKRITIDPSYSADNHTIATMTTLAVNDAINNARNIARQKMSELTGGLDIPDLF
ncbi:MAG: YbaB/EbfC family nucleoid-associated protein [Victivallaceae bacterium]|jgi:DNA-binding YbaB/EbfC family protein|nr:YbaB/EbfC family nucleoid-associated protein [Victivallaceae bacterium]MDD4318029.1 YbaB/EbfC family nucleoid-associated protein [Victivallaceae bacterium]MDD5663601.1 YbaB/EbfC family nucleoid-associated protein [Victivallaceae bacterium]NLK83391.1 YbaB/EbfC family nucleoid-associated protein [Lentisphaerota bacterium]